MNKKIIITSATSFFVVILIIIGFFRGIEAPDDKLPTTRDGNTETSTLTDPERGVAPALSFKSLNQEIIKIYIQSLKNVGLDSEKKEQTVVETEEKSDDASKTVPKSTVRERIKLISPKWGEIWSVGEQKEITWSTTGVLDKVNIVLQEAPFVCQGDRTCESMFAASVPFYKLARGAANTGVFLWSVGKTWSGADMPPTKYTVKIEDTSRRVYAESNTFAIVSKKMEEIEIKFPPENYVFVLSGTTTPAIVWSMPPSVFEVNILLSDRSCGASCPPGAIYHLAENEIGTNVFVWYSGRDLSGKSIPTGEYLLKIEDSKNNLIKGFQIIKIEG